MNQQPDIPEEIYADEIVCFLADRYHTAPRQVLQRFIGQDNPVLETSPDAFRLEENEMAILRDLLAGYHL